MKILKEIYTACLTNQLYSKSVSTSIIVSGILLSDLNLSDHFSVVKLKFPLYPSLSM